MKPAPKKQSGQSLVEMAISLVVIITLLLGAVETSLAIFQYVTIRDAAQEGAIYGSSIDPTDLDGIQYRAIATAADVMDIDPDTNPDATITIMPSGESCEGQDAVTGAPNLITVTITFNHHIAFPFFSPAKTIKLTATVTNAILYPRCE